MNLENDLRRALRREPPPAGFAGRVLQRIEVEEGQSRVSGQAGSAHFRWWRATAASVMLAAVLGGYALHEVHRREGERARDEVLRAMSIASAKVRYAQQQVRQIGSH
jgi:hypothetical protein